MRVTSTITRRVHLYLGASEQFPFEGKPALQTSDAKRRASIRIVDVSMTSQKDPTLRYSVTLRGVAINRDGSRGSIDRTYGLHGLDRLPADIADEVERLFDMQRLDTPDVDYVVARTDGPTSGPGDLVIGATA